MSKYGQFDELLHRWKDTMLSFAVTLNYLTSLTLYSLERCPIGSYSSSCHVTTGTKESAWLHNPICSERPQQPSVMLCIHNARRSILETSREQTFDYSLSLCFGHVLAILSIAYLYRSQQYIPPITGPKRDDRPWPNRTSP